VAFTHEDILEELQERYSDAVSEWKTIKSEGAADMRAIAGDPWDPEERRKRDAADRPCLSLDELSQYTNQTINDLRSNKRGILVTPAGGGSTDETAKLRQGLIRDIEYRCNATQAYTTAAENAIQRGYGFMRVRAEYVHPDRGFDQQLVIEPVVDPDRVTPDPDHVRTDGTDFRYLFYEQGTTHKQFLKDYPQATVRSFSSETITNSHGWVTGDQLRLAEYWTKEAATRRKLLLLKPGQPSAADPNPQPNEVFEDQLGGKLSSDEILKSRWITPSTVKQYLTNGIEILDETTWLGPSIPWASVYGKVLYLADADGRAQRQLLSMVRLARDPYMLYCYYRTCQAELVGMTPKFPYFVAKGQLDAANLQLLADSLHTPVAVIEYLTKTMTQPEGGLGPPSRQPYEPPIAGLEMGAEGARRAIQAAIGQSPLPSSAQRHNDKSGVALQTIEDSGQRGNFHFVDHHDEGVQRIGAILNECIPFYYDTMREVSVRDAKDQPQQATINDPRARDAEGQPAHLDTKHGDHDVTISVGPKKDSDRKAANDFADALIGSPAILQIAGPQKAQEILASSIRLKNLGPIGDEMADTLSPRDKQKVDPRQAQQHLAELQGQLEKLQQVAAGQQKQIDTDQIKTDGQIRIKQMDIDFQQFKLGQESETKITVAELGAKVDRLQLFLEERARLGLQAAAVASQQHDAAHDVGMATLDQAHALEEGQQAHDQTVAQTQQQGAQQADLLAQGHEQTLAAQAAAPVPETSA
jgi:hypothetical protein